MVARIFEVCFQGVPHGYIEVHDDERVSYGDECIERLVTNLANRDGLMPTPSTCGIWSTGSEAHGSSSPIHRTADAEAEEEVTRRRETTCERVNHVRRIRNSGHSRRRGFIERDQHDPNKASG